MPTKRSSAKPSRRAPPDARLTARAVSATLRRAGSPEQAAFALRYFRTGPGEYGEGDRFLGIRAPEVRRLVRQYEALPLAEAVALLGSEWHEARLVALLILVRQYERGGERERAAIYRAYLDSTARINNWDLVDSSAAYIVGRHLAGRSTAPLTKLARSRSLWERRIAIIATHWFIRQGDFDETLRIAELLLDDEHDLIHKAAGWMLREVGKRGGLDREEAFLARHHNAMPRTMLRYAIERFPPARRQAYLRGTV